MHITFATNANGDLGFIITDDSTSDRITALETDEETDFYSTYKVRKDVLHTVEENVDIEVMELLGDPELPDFKATALEHIRRVACNNGECDH